MATVKSGAVLIGEKELKKTLKNLGIRGDKELRREVQRTGIGIKNSYKRNIKNNYITGELEKSISSDSQDGWKSVEIGSDVPQSIWIEFGTKAHKIKAKTAPALAWKNITGLVGLTGAVTEWMFSKEVQHPGTKANPGLLKAWMEWMVGSKFTRRLEKRFDRIK